MRITIRNSMSLIKDLCIAMYEVVIDSPLPMLLVLFILFLGAMQHSPSFGVRCVNVCLFLLGYFWLYKNKR